MRGNLEAQLTRSSNSQVRHVPGTLTIALQLLDSPTNRLGVMGSVAHPSRLICPDAPTSGIHYLRPSRLSATSSVHHCAITFAHGLKLRNNFMPYFVHPNHATVVE